MTWAYSGDPSSSDLDEVRFLIQDTDNGLQLLSDEEIEFLLERWLNRYDSVTYVAAVAAATISRKFVGTLSINADGVNVPAGDLVDRYKALAQQLRAEYVASQIGGQIDLTNIMIGQGHDYSIKPLSFAIGLHDNPEAGMQDYGGWLPDPFEDASQRW